MDPFTHDVLYEVMSFLDYPNILNLCRTNKVIGQFCRTNRLVQDLLNIKKDTHEYIQCNENDLSQAFSNATGNDEIDVIDDMIRMGFDPSEDDNESIKESCKYGNLESVKRLLKDPRVDPSATNNYAIIWASVANHYEIVKLLLKDPRVDPRAAIGAASRNGHLETVKLLLEDPRVDPRVNNYYAIRQATEYGHDEVAKLLLNHPLIKNKYEKINKERGAVM